MIDVGNHKRAICGTKTVLGLVQSCEYRLISAKGFALKARARIDYDHKQSVGREQSLDIEL